jgi:RimJ/RimL family protein N-acetyltransferase
MGVEFMPLEEEDIRGGYLRLVWRSTVNIHPFPYSSRRLLQWVFDAESHDGVFFAVRDPASGQMCGVVALKISWVPQTAQIIEFVFDQSPPSAPAEAAKALVQYVEATLRLHRLWLITVDDELARSMESAGFEREGVLRRHFLHHGQYRDGYLLAHVTEGGP